MFWAKLFVVCKSAFFSAKSEDKTSIALAICRSFCLSAIADGFFSNSILFRLCIWFKALIIFVSSTTKFSFFCSFVKLEFWAIVWIVDSKFGLIDFTTSLTSLSLKSTIWISASFEIEASLAATIVLSTLLDWIPLEGSIWIEFFNTWSLFILASIWAYSVSFTLFFCSYNWAILESIICTVLLFSFWIAVCFSSNFKAVFKFISSMFDG